jgi:hypothetical protein
MGERHNVAYQCHAGWRKCSNLVVGIVMGIFCAELNMDGTVWRTVRNGAVHWGRALRAQALVVAMSLVAYTHLVAMAELATGTGQFFTADNSWRLTLRQ